MTCDDYQIAFDQLAAGASTSVSAAEVDAHVAACAACTAYASLSRKLSVSLMNTLSMSPPPLDLDAMRVRIDRLRRRTRRWMALGPAFFFAWGVFIQVVVHRVGADFAVISSLFGALLFYAVWAAWTRRYTAAIAALEAKSGDDLVVGLRAELDRRVRSERDGWWVLPIVLALYHWKFAGLAMPSLRILIVEIVLVSLVPLAIVRYRRAKRERALLG